MVAELPREKKWAWFGGDDGPGSDAAMGKTIERLGNTPADKRGAAHFSLHGVAGAGMVGYFGAFLSPL